MAPSAVENCRAPTLFRVLYPVAVGGNPPFGEWRQPGRIARQPDAVIRPDLRRSQPDGIEQALGAVGVHELADLVGSEPPPSSAVDAAVDVLADEAAAEDERDLVTTQVRVDPGEDHGPNQQARVLPHGALDGLVDGLGALHIAAGWLPAIGVTPGHGKQAVVVAQDGREDDKRVSRGRNVALLRL
jgi:hypothetical protein